MAESFDPYRDWLNFASGQRPVTHYALFGLEPLESDADEIRRAIAQLMAKVRGIRPGNRMRVWQEMIDEISTAKACLTDPAAKAAYDAQLSGSLGMARAASHHPGCPRPIPIALQSCPTPQPADSSQAPQAWPGQPDVAARPPEYVPPASDSDTAPSPVPSGIVVRPDARLRRRNTSIAYRTFKGLLSLLVLLAIGVGFVKYRRYLNDRPLARVRQPDPTAVDTSTGRLPGHDSADTAAEEFLKVSMQKNLTELVAALAARDISVAEGFMDQARANASSPDDQKTVDKYERLFEDVREFWRIIGDRVSKFRPQEEVALGKTRIIVVEARGGRFSFRYGRKIFEGPIETMPTWLVVVLADGNLDSDGRSKELYGAFLAVDPEGDRSRARALWSEAASAGVKIEESLPSLDSLLATQSQSASFEQ
ncbi:MAG: hypothetical protein GXY83_41635 [Rhodopirellula sp.]|nr:hypothetical protein [Rhodopirellula sp.]